MTVGVTARALSFTIAITLTVLLGVIHALTALTLATRPRLEAWALRRAYGTGLYPHNHA